MRGFASLGGLDVYEVRAHDAPLYVSLLVASASATDSSSAEILFHDEGCLDEFIERLIAARRKTFGPPRPKRSPEELFNSMTGITKSLSDEEGA